MKKRNRNKVEGLHLWGVTFKSGTYDKSTTLLVITPSQNATAAIKKAIKRAKATIIAGRFDKMEYRGTLDA